MAAAKKRKRKPATRRPEVVYFKSMDAHNAQEKLGKARKRKARAALAKARATRKRRK